MWAAVESFQGVKLYNFTSGSMNNCKFCLPQTNGVLHKLPSTKPLWAALESSLSTVSVSLKKPPPYFTNIPTPCPHWYWCVPGGCWQPRGCWHFALTGDLAELTQFLAGRSCPQGPWGRAVWWGGAQAAPAREGGGGGPEELRGFVRLGAAVFAARLCVGRCRHRHGHARQGGQRRRQWGAWWVVMVLLSQEQPWKHTEVSHIPAQMYVLPPIPPQMLGMAHLVQLSFSPWCCFFWHHMILSYKTAFWK